MKTTVVPVSAPGWVLIDADGQSLGRVAARAARMLRGKHRPTFSPHQLCGDHVVIVNAEKIAVSPAKGRRKTYYDHTGYLGSITSKTLAQVMTSDRPQEALEKAIKGMLPRNRLRASILKRLHLFVGKDHPYAAQKPVSLNLSDL